MFKIRVCKLIGIFILSFLMQPCNADRIDSDEDVTVLSTNTQNELIDLGKGWFQVTSSVTIENITPEKAKELAIQNACKRAIEYFSGIEISGSMLNIQAETDKQVLIDNFSSITRQTIQGIIVEKEILEDKIITNGNQLLKVVTLKVKVDKQKGEKDAAFEITASLNREYFNNGEVLELSVKASKDCYITILNICSNDSVYVLFPNNFRQDNFVKSGELFHLPDSNDRAIGLYFPVNLLPYKNEDH